MKTVEKRVVKLVGMEGSCGDGRKLWGWGAMEVVWLRGGLNCVEVLGPCNQLFLKVHRVFGEGRGITGEHDQVGVWTVESGWEFE